MGKRLGRQLTGLLLSGLILCLFAACGNDIPEDTRSAASSASRSVSAPVSAAEAPETAGDPAAAAEAAGVTIHEEYYPVFVHGDKGPEYQKYIMLHDTEGDGSAANVISYWLSAGAGVASHFIVDKDGTITQCVPLDMIAHHAGYGDTGHNELFGVTDESRDDFVGTQNIGPYFADYGMNSYSVGIEMVHVGGSGLYPEAQLEALDGLIAYIDAYYGFECPITDHKAWRSGNSDTSQEFSVYLQNYQDHRTHL